jgi:hypothetical protein
VLSQLRIFEPGATSSQPTKDVQYLRAWLVPWEGVPTPGRQAFQPKARSRIRFGKVCYQSPFPQTQILKDAGESSGISSDLVLSSDSSSHIPRPLLSSFNCQITRLPTHTMEGVASSSSMAPTHRRTRDSRRNISAQSWEIQRPTIERLYSIERRTLREVMEIMENDHGFFATCVFLSFSVASRSQSCSFLRSMGSLTSI